MLILALHQRVVQMWEICIMVDSSPCDTSCIVSNVLPSIKEHMIYWIYTQITVWTKYNVLPNMVSAYYQSGIQMYPTGALGSYNRDIPKMETRLILLSSIFDCTTISFTFVSMYNCSEHFEEQTTVWISWIHHVRLSWRSCWQVQDQCGKNQLAQNTLWAPLADQLPPLIVPIGYSAE